MQNFKFAIQRLLKHALAIHQKMEYKLIMHTSVVGKNYFNTFHSKYIVLDDLSTIDDTIDVLVQMLLSKLKVRPDDIEIRQFIVRTRKISNRKGGYLPLPVDILRSNTVINVQNDDDYAFKWAVISCSRRGNDLSQQVEDITLERIHCKGVDFDFSNLEFPLEVHHCRFFERNNPHISVNVFGLDVVMEESYIYGPLYRTRLEKKIHVNLLYMEDPESNRSHYAYIPELNQLLVKYRACDLHAQFTSQYTCNTCLRGFVTGVNFARHCSDRRNCDKPLYINPLTIGKEDDHNIHDHQIRFDNFSLRLPTN